MGDEHLTCGSWSGKTIDFPQNRTSVFPKQSTFSTGADTLSATTLRLSGSKTRDFSGISRGYRMKKASLPLRKGRLLGAFSGCFATPECRCISSSDYGASEVFFHCQSRSSSVEICGNRACTPDNDRRLGRSR